MGRGARATDVWFRGSLQHRLFFGGFRISLFGVCSPWVLIFKVFKKDFLFLSHIKWRESILPILLLSVQVLF
jgi:hypothetical protein